MDGPLCAICHEPLHDGQPLVPYVTGSENVSIAYVAPPRQLHASCAQELRGEAEG